MAGNVYKMVPIETIRGCPYTCKFCNSPDQMALYNKETNGGFFRKKRMDLVSKELKHFMSEMVHVQKTGHQITVAQCDAGITDISPFKKNKDWEIKGRGGTDFQPVIDHFNERRGRYTALIYLTDGEAPSPENCPKNTLWVLSAESQWTDELPGQVIQLNEF